MLPPQRHGVARAALIPSLFLSLYGTGLCADKRADVEHLATDETTELAFLIQLGSADSLATASLLAHLTRVPEDERPPGAPPQPEPAQLIERAVSMAHDRPELVWLQLRECEVLRCPEEAKIAAHLQALDPDNGLARLGDLNAAQAKSAQDVNRVIEQIGAAHAPSIYWNRLTVMMFDALTHRDGQSPPTAITQHADDRLMHVTAVLAAVEVPALKPLAFLCKSDQFAQAGRRDACEHAMARLADSDAVVPQLMRLSVEEEWWPASSAKGADLRREHLQRRYSTVASNRLRAGHGDRDAETRVAAMRRFPREEDVERAMLTNFHEPLERPADWHSPGD